MDRLRIPLLLAAGLALLLLASGCASTYSKLLDEDECSQLLAMKECWRRPSGRKCHTVITHGSTGPEVSIAVHELGDPAGPVVVLIHGVFADHETWRFVAGDLARDHHVFLVDLPGCGYSYAPDLSRADEPLVYSPDAMARRVLEALRGAVPPSQPLTVVAHSLGALLVVHMLGDTSLREEFSGVTDRFGRLVLLAPPDAGIEKASPLFLKLASINGLDVALASLTGILDEEVAKGVRRSVAHESLALRQEADNRREILVDGRHRGAMQAMLRLAVPRERFAGAFYPDWPAIDALEPMYTRIDRPCLIIWGDWDEILPVSMGYKLWATIPTSDLRTIPACKHSAHLEQPAAVVALIREFCAETGPVEAHATPARSVNSDLLVSRRPVPAAPVGTRGATPSPTDSAP